MTHILAVQESLTYNIETQREEYTQQLEVTEDIIEWLDAHDISYTSKTEKVYICNNIRYIYMGPKLAPLIPMAKQGEA